MKISVAMCTYNGADFLPAQLESIAAQTRPPDEILICDDLSNDGTQSVIKDSGLPVVLHINDKNLGSIKTSKKPSPAAKATSSR